MTVAAARLPAKDTLERLKLLFEVFLLVLAVPLVCWHFATRPRRAAEHTMAKAIG